MAVIASALRQEGSTGGVSNESIDSAVGRALAAGPSGAKITGAGGGGFLLAICPVEYQRAVRESLSDMRELPIKFDTLGTRIVLNVARDICTYPSTGGALQGIGRITTAHSALVYLEVPGAANEVRDVRKVALVNLRCVGTDDDSVRGVPGRSL